MNEKPQLGLSKSSGSQTKDDDKAWKKNTEKKHQFTYGRIRIQIAVALSESMY